MFSTSPTSSEVAPFYEELIGLVTTVRDSHTAYLRGVEGAEHHSLVLRDEDEATAERIGFRVESDDDFDVAMSFFDDSGLDARWVERPYQGCTLAVSDVASAPFEFCATLSVEPRKVFEHHLLRGAAAAGLDHVQVHAPDLDRFTSFHCRLGFRISECMTDDGTSDGALLGVFLTHRGDLVDVAGISNVGPRLHHFSWLVRDPSSFIRVADIAPGLGMRDVVEYGPARHSLAPPNFYPARPGRAPNGTGGRGLSLYRSRFGADDLAAPL